MNNFKRRFTWYSLILIFILVISIFYRINLNLKEKNNVHENLEGKTIVRLWIKKSLVSPLRGYQIEKYNKENKDNIYVILNEYKEDYYNLLRVSLASDNGPDIFEYGFTSLIKNNQIATLDDIKFNYSLVDNSNIVRYMDKKIGVKIIETNEKLIWNKEVFKKAGLDPNRPPKNWEELIEFANKIKKANPEIVPFAFPMKEYKDIKISVGQPSVKLASIYTSFWDYKKGEYNFNYSKDILNFYRKMYELNLIDSNFDKKSYNQLRSEFYQGNIAMMISSFEDKTYFANILPLGFELGISDIPQVGAQNNSIYYFVDNNNFLVINNKSIEDENKKQAVKKVYEYLLTENVNKEILQTRASLPINLKDYNIKNDVYSEYNNIKNYKNEEYDPTIFLSRNSALEIKQIIDVIKGEITVDEGIKNLNEQYKKYFNFAKDKEGFDFNYYTK